MGLLYQANVRNAEMTRTSEENCSLVRNCRWQTNIQIQLTRQFYIRIKNFGQMMFLPW